MSVWTDLGVFLGTSRPEVTPVEGIPTVRPVESSLLQKDWWPGYYMAMGPEKFGEEIEAGMGPQAEARGQQMALMQALQAQMRGEGPSLAREQLRESSEESLRQAMALGAAQQGQGLAPGTALRNIAEQQAMARQRGAGQAAQIRAMEQLQAQGQLGQLLGGMRGQDIGTAAQRAQSALAMRQLLGQGYMGAAQLAGERDITEFQAKYGAGLAAQKAQSMADLQRQQLLFASGESAKGRGERASERGGQTAQAIGQGIAMVAGASRGGVVEGKSKVPWDSSANDTEPRMLSPGEAVIPKSIMQSEDAPSNAAKFIAALKGGNGSIANEYGMFDGGIASGPSPAAAGFLPSMSDYRLPSPAAAGFLPSMSDYRLPPSAATVSPMLGSKPPSPTATISLPGTLGMPDRKPLIPTAAKPEFGFMEAPTAPTAPREEIPGRKPLQPQESQLPELSRKEFEAQLQTMQQATTEREAAIKEEARLAGIAGQEKSKVIQQQIVDNKEIDARRMGIEADHAAQTDKWMGDLRGMMTEYGNMKVDPKRLFTEMGTGQKMLSVIGLALGGLGAGSTGGVNRAVQTLEGLIDKDINAQVVNMEKEGKRIGQEFMVFGAMRDKFGDSMASIGASKAAIKERYALLTEDIAAKMAGSEAGAKATQIAAGIRASQAKDLAGLELQFQSKAADVAADNARIDIARKQMAAGQQQQVTTTEISPGWVSTGQIAITPTEAAKFRNVVGVADDVSGATDKLSEIHERKGTELFGKEAAQMKSLSIYLKVQLKELAQLGVLSASDLKLLEGLVPDPTTFTSAATLKSTIRAQLNTLQETVKRSLASKAQSLGIQSSGQGQQVIGQ